MVTMAQSAANWRNAHNHVDRRQTHIHTHTHTHTHTRVHARTSTHAHTHTNTHTHTHTHTQTLTHTHTNNTTAKNVTYNATSNCRDNRIIILERTAE